MGKDGGRRTGVRRSNLPEGGSAGVVRSRPFEQFRVRRPGVGVSKTKSSRFHPDLLSVEIVQASTMTKVARMNLLVVDVTRGRARSCSVRPRTNRQRCDEKGDGIRKKRNEFRGQ